jgi:prepilin-type N-terminal cleavage/methylation domain-containing protein
LLPNYHSSAKIRAFTLIELLVVIAIVGILSSVIYTNITGLRDRAKITAGIRFDSSTLHSIGDQLVGEWTFDSPNLPLIDTSGFGNTGTCTACPTYATTSGYNNKGAYSFDGINDYIRIADSDILRMNGTSNLTMSAWIKISNLADSDEQFIVSKYGYVANTGYSLEVLSTGAVRMNINGGANSKTTATKPIIAGVWSHIVGEFSNGNTIKVYVNGSLIQTWPITQTTLISNNGILAIGSPSDNAGIDNYSLSGLIDDVRIYSSALSSSDIQKLYAEGKASHEVVVK